MALTIKLYMENRYLTGGLVAVQAARKIAAINRLILAA